MATTKLNTFQVLINNSKYYTKQIPLIPTHYSTEKPYQLFEWSTGDHTRIGQRSKMVICDQFVYLGSALIRTSRS